MNCFVADLEVRYNNTEESILYLQKETMYWLKNSIGNFAVLLDQCMVESSRYFTSYWLQNVIIALTVFTTVNNKETNINYKKQCFFKFKTSYKKHAFCAYSFMRFKERANFSWLTGIKQFGILINSFYY